MKITYLFGAGASCGALPMIKYLPDRLKYLFENLQLEVNRQLQNQSKDDIFLDQKDIEWIRKISLEFKKLEEICRLHSSVDTYAKKLFIKKDWERLNKLKAILSVYFIVEMVITNGKVDVRYDNFWASILGSFATHLPDNLRIVTWNYDSQLEQTFLEYSYDPTLSNTYFSLNIQDADNRAYQIGKEKFAIYKMNGTANYAKNNEDNSYGYLFDNYKGNFKNELFPKLKRFIENSYLFYDTPQILHTTMTYAWETINGKNNRGTLLNRAKSDIQSTEILVVIGYSFPYFNREIDRALFRESAIRKIYVQDPNSESIIANLQSIFDDESIKRGIKFVPIPPNETQFFIPPEL